MVPPRQKAKLAILNEYDMTSYTILAVGSSDTGLPAEMKAAEDQEGEKRELCNGEQDAFQNVETEAGQSEPFVLFSHRRVQHPTEEDHTGRGDQFQDDVEMDESRVSHDSCHGPGWRCLPP